MRLGRTGTVRARLLRGVACLVAAQLVAVGLAEPAGATNPPPTAVSLAASATILSAGQTSTLTATANADVFQTGTFIQIFDLTTNTAVRGCSSGSVCTYGPFSLNSGPPQSYEARIVNSATLTVQVTSNVVTISRAPWTVSLATDKTVLRAGESATLTATANQNAGLTGTYVISIFDQTPGSSGLLRSCTTGTTCSTTVQINSGPPHTYIAYVAKAGSGQPPPDVQATSGTVTIGRAPWTLTLDADRTVITVGQVVTFTATAAQDVGPTPYSILLYDVTNSTLFRTCSTGTTCSQGIAPTAANHWYVAYVATASTALPPPNVQARSNLVNVQVDGAQTRGCGNRTGTANPTTHREDPVDTATGALCVTATDLRLSGRGVPFTLTRTYNSADSAAGPFGPGWTSTIGPSLLGAGTATVTVRAEDGQQIGYARQPDGSYTGAPGAASTLTQVTGGYRLTTPDQVVYAFDAAGALTSLVDRHGDGVVLSYSGGKVTTATDAAGRVVTFGYAGDRLTQATLPDGRAVTYGYTGGRLTSVTDPAGATTSYGYDAAGRLTTVTDPLGHAVERTVYDPASGRAVEQYDALGRRTAFGWDPATGTATTTDARGGVTTDVYRGNVLIRTTDPTGATTKYGYDENLRLAYVIDPLGRLSTMTYDRFGDLLTHRAPEPLSSLEQYTYDADNDLLTAVDGRGITVVTDTYDTSGRLVTSTDALGGTTTFAYGSGADLAAVTDARGKTTSYVHDAAGNLTAVVSPLGERTTMGYDDAGRFVERVDPRGNVSGATGATRAAYRTTFAYDAADRLSTVTDPRGAVTAYGYDVAGRLTSRTDALGHVTRYGYDDAGRLVTRTEPPNPTTGAVTGYGYDATGNLVAVITPLGHRTGFGYDLAGRRTSVVDPRGNESGATAADFTTTYAYDGAGNLTRVTGPPATGMVMTVGYDALDRPVTVTDALSHTTATTYDAAGQILSVTNPLGATRTLSYDAAGRVVATTDERAKTTAYGYDPAGNLTTRTSPLGEVTAYGYDDDSRLGTVVDPRGNVAPANPADYTTRLSYDPAGNRTAVTDPLGHVSQWTVDAAGNATLATDPNGHATGYTYDLLDRLTAVRGADVAADAVTPATGAARYTYDAAGNPTGRTDPLGHVTNYAYDADHRVTTVTDPLGRHRDFSYDAAGHQTGIVTARGTTTADPATGTVTSSYDPLGRLITVDYGDTTPDVTYAYDAAGRLASMGDGDGRGTAAALYSYDAASRLTAVTRSGNGFGYAHDAAGNITGRTYPDGATVAYGYDDDNWLATVAYAGGTTSYGYDAAGNLLTTTLPPSNGNVESRTFDRAGRLVGIRNARGNNVLSSFDRMLDPAGNPTRLTVTRGTVAIDTAYAYDAADRLTQVCPAATTCTAATQYATYGYDTVGNRTALSHDGAAIPDTTYLYDSADELVTETTGTAVIHDTYDPDGNLTASTTPGGPSRIYTYNLANRLTATSVQDSPVAAPRTSTYTFDGNGNRTTRSQDGLAVERIDWDTTASPATPALRRAPDGSLRQRLVTGLAALALTAPGGTSYLHHDLLGSTSDVTSDTGTAQVRYDYDPFGAITATTLDASAPANDLTYTGQIRDADTGTYHLHARQYSPATSRFQSTDPVAAPAADPARSTYAYAFDNPVRFIDPSGRWPSATWIDVLARLARRSGADRWLASVAARAVDRNVAAERTARHDDSPPFEIRHAPPTREREAPTYSDDAPTIVDIRNPFPFGPPIDEHGFGDWVLDNPLDAVTVTLGVVAVGLSIAAVAGIPIVLGAAIVTPEMATMIALEAAVPALVFDSTQYFGLGDHSQWVDLALSTSGALLSVAAFFVASVPLAWIGLVVGVVGLVKTVRRVLSSDCSDQQPRR